MASRRMVAVRKAFEDLSPRIQRQARRAYAQFKDDPSHPSLHFKQVHPTRPNYSARVTLGYRAVGVKEGDEMVWFWIGPHDDYERMLPRL